MNDMASQINGQQSVPQASTATNAATAGSGATAEQVSVNQHADAGWSSDVLLAQRNFELVVREQDVDPRESQVEYVVSIKNPSTQRIRVMSLRSFAPRGAEVQDVVDTSLTTQRLRLTQIYNDLSQLLGEFLIGSSAEYQEALTRTLVSILDTKISTAGFLKRVLFGSSRLVLIEAARKAVSSETAWRVDIKTATQARQYYEECLAPQQASAPALCQLFSAKLAEATDLEPELRTNIWIADLEPGAVYSRTYVFNCKRRLANPKPYTFSFDCAFQILDAQNEPIRHCTGGITADISPSPSALNLIAVASGVLGAVLKIAIDEADTHGTNATLQITRGLLSTQLNTVATWGTIISAMITALLFFNIYDSTQIGSKLKFGSGWRSALLVGGLSGLATEKVVAALKALLG